MENKHNGRQQLEDIQNGKQPKWKMTKMKDDQNER